MAANNEKILIVSATSRNNLVLAKRLSEFLDGHTDVEIVNLEDYELPLFRPGIDCDHETLIDRIESGRRLLWMKINLKNYAQFLMILEQV